MMSYFLQSFAGDLQQVFFWFKQILFVVCSEGFNVFIGTFYCSSLERLYASALQKHRRSFRASEVTGAGLIVPNWR